MIAISILLLLTILGADSLAPGDHHRSITIGNLNRSYLVHIPPGYDSMRPTPVVLAFHGGGTNADAMVTFSGLNKKADKAGFIVVYPSGTGRLAKLPDKANDGTTITRKTHGSGRNGAEVALLLINAILLGPAY